MEVRTKGSTGGHPSANIARLCRLLRARLVRVAGFSIIARRLPALFDMQAD